MLERLSQSTMESVLFAREEMRRAGRQAITPTDLMAGFLLHQDNIINSLLSASGITINELRHSDFTDSETTYLADTEIRFDPELEKLLELAHRTAHANGMDLIYPEHLLAAAVQSRFLTIARYLAELEKFNPGVEELVMKAVRERATKIANESLKPKFDQSKSAEDAQTAQKKLKKVMQKAGSYESRLELQLAFDDYSRALEKAYPEGFWDNYMKLKARQPEALEMAITFLEDDPYFFRSGYMKQDLIYLIPKQPLNDEQKRRLGQVVLAAIDKWDRPRFRSYCRLARKVITDELYAEISSRSLSEDSGIKRRATWVLHGLSRKFTR